MPASAAPTSFRRRRLIAACLGLGIASSRAQVLVEGQTFAAHARVAGTDLVLNGVGLRAVAWIKGYAAGLYLPRKVTTPEQVLAMPGAKRLQIRMLLDVPAVEFVTAFGKGVRRNSPEGQLPALQARMQRFDALIGGVGQVRKGDVVDIDFEPGKGLVFTLNGRVRGEPIEGEDFYAAFLRIFLGVRPADPELKEGLLGGPIR